MPSLSTICRSKTGILTLPYFTDYPVGFNATVKLKQVDCCYSDFSINGSVASPEQAPISRSGSDSTFPVVTITWTATFSTAENFDGTHRITLLSLTQSAPGYSGIVTQSISVAGIYLAVGQYIDVEDCTLGQVGNPRAQWTVYTYSPNTQVMGSSALFGTPGYWRFKWPWHYAADLYLTGGSGNARHDVMWGQAAYDVPADCSSSFGGPSDWTSGEAPFRLVEWQALASGLIVGTVYNVRYTFEWRPIGSAGAWSSSPAVSSTITFMAGAALEALPWIAVPSVRFRQQGLGCTFCYLNEHRLASAVFF